MTRAGQDPADVIAEAESGALWVSPKQVDAERDRRIAAYLSQTVGRPFLVEEALKAVMDGQREPARLLNIKVRKPENWTEDMEARAEALEALDSAIIAIEEAAGALKATEPIPDDYAADLHWPSTPA